MIFIGVISSKRKFYTLNNLLKEKINIKEAKLIKIDNKSIKNLKSVKFEILIIDSLEKITDEIFLINSICNNLKYLIINSDIELDNNLLVGDNTRIITCGLKQKATVTFSSVTDERVLISVQKSIRGYTKSIEVGEYSEKINIGQRTNLNEILLAFIIEKLLK